MEEMLSLFAASLQWKAQKSKSETGSDCERAATPNDLLSQIESKFKEMVNKVSMYEHGNGQLCKDESHQALQQKLEEEIQDHKRTILGMQRFFIIYLQLW